MKLWRYEGLLMPKIPCLQTSTTFSYRSASQHAELLGRQGILNVFRCFTTSCQSLKPNALMIAGKSLSAGVEEMVIHWWIVRQDGRKVVITRNWKSDFSVVEFVYVSLINMWCWWCVFGCFWQIASSLRLPNIHTYKKINTIDYSSTNSWNTYTPKN